MPRKSRIDAAGAIHYVMVKGIERGAVFSGAIPTGIIIISA
jgi:hypothetical protein